MRRMELVIAAFLVSGTAFHSRNENFDLINESKNLGFRRVVAMHTERYRVPSHICT